MISIKEEEESKDLRFWRNWRRREEPKGRRRIVRMGIERTRWRSEHDEGLHGRRKDQVNRGNRVLNTRFPRGFFFHIRLTSHTTRVLESQDASLLHSFVNMTTN